MNSIGFLKKIKIFLLNYIIIIKIKTHKINHQPDIVIFIWNDDNFIKNKLKKLLWSSILK
jgi:hypothetical protein